MVDRTAPPWVAAGHHLRRIRRVSFTRQALHRLQRDSTRDRERNLPCSARNKGVSKLPIHLKIYSPNVLNSPFVDLPGLTKIPVGDQPSISSSRSATSSLTTSPAQLHHPRVSQRMSTCQSDSLKLARTVDPQGRRTIGVLTKLDLMEQGTHALDILTGRVYPLKLGFIGVVNRSQQESTGNVSMLAARRAERSSSLARRLQEHRASMRHQVPRQDAHQVLMSHIRDKLPDMKARLNTLMGQTQQELALSVTPPSSETRHRGSLVLKLMTQFARDFVASIDGTTFDISTKELCGGARIYYIFQDVFGHALPASPYHNLTCKTSAPQSETPPVRALALCSRSRL